MKYRMMIAALLSTMASAGQVQAASYEDTARVLSVEPRMDRVNKPYRDCSAADTERGLTGGVLGAVAGGVLGAQVGKGNGRVAAAAVGAATGAMVGDRVQNGGTTGNGNCPMVDNWQTKPMGYTVTYEYQGQRMTEYMPNPPGDVLRVRVNVAPIR